MAGRLTRFLNLEKRRPDREEPAREEATPGRFTPSSEQPVAPAGQHTVSTPVRFVPPALSLDRAEHAFARCPSCGSDAGAFDVQRCTNCGTRLDSEAARA